MSNKKIKVAIIGATGFVGVELMRLLASHNNVSVEHLTSVSYADKNIDDVYGQFNKVYVLPLKPKEDLAKISKEVDVIFLAMPHGIAAKEVTNEIINNAVVIDLGADFRLKDKNVYEKWYKEEHLHSELLDKAVYGLSELNREAIKKARLIANPGCYTTCSILALAPLLKHKLIDEDTIIIDAKSGVTGAGRSVSLDNIYCEINESTHAYKVCNHRHTPEIEQELSKISGKEIKLSFTPHLIPMNRGILATSYAKLKDGVKKDDIRKAYLEEYEKEYFVRLLDEKVYPKTAYVKNSNFIDINFEIDERTGRIIVLSAIDNLIKGASGQAIQNMNIIFGFEENQGLKYVPVFG